MLFLWGAATLFIAFVSRDLIKKYFIPTKKVPLAAGALPLFGHLFSLDWANLHTEFLRMAKDSGPIFRVMVGSTDWVIVTSYELVKKVLGSQQLSNRPLQFLDYEITCGDNIGIIHANGAQCMEQKEFIRNHFHRVCGPNSEAPQKAVEHMDRMQKWLDKEITLAQERRCVIQPNKMLEICVGWILADVVMGKTYSIGDKEFERIRELYGQVADLHINGSWSMVNCWAWLRRMPLDIFGFKRYSKANSALLNLLERVVNAREAIIHDEEDPDDVIGCYLKAMVAAQIEGDAGKFTKKQLLHILEDIWVSGFEKTVQVLNWAVLYLIRYPDIQEKVRLEIEENVGTTRNPSYDDQKRLPYAKAVLSEAQRVGSVLDMTYLHCAKQNLILEEYDIPAGTVVIPFLYGIHMDAEAFYQSDRFIPERFMEHMSRDTKTESYLIPFGEGPRRCVGDELANMILFVVFTTLMQKFKFVALPGRDFPDMKFIRVNTLQPVEYKCAVEKRQLDGLPGGTFEI